MPIWWILVFAMRVAWTLMGQTGYIHPDEFFQSSEVIAGIYFVPNPRNNSSPFAFANQ